MCQMIWKNVSLEAEKCVTCKNDETLMNKGIEGHFLFT